MFTIHTITVIFIAFFMLYQAIGKENTVNNKKVVNFKRRIDVKIARWILSMKRKSFHEINEESYKTLKKWQFAIWISCFVLLIIKTSYLTVYLCYIGFVIIPIVILGLLSFKRLIASFKRKFMENLKFSIVIVIGLIIIISMMSKAELNLLIEPLNKASGDFYFQLRQLHVFNLENITPWELTGIMFLILAGVVIVVYLIIRPITMFILWLNVSFAKFCFFLNYKSPLRPFYLIGQVLAIIITELVTKVLNKM